MAEIILFPDSSKLNIVCYYDVCSSKLVFNGLNCSVFSTQALSPLKKSLSMHTGLVQAMLYVLH